MDKQNIGFVCPYTHTYTHNASKFSKLGDSPQPASVSCGCTLGFF